MEKTRKETEIPVIDMEKTGKNIKELRRRAGISTDGLQEALGLTGKSAIYKWQCGHSLPSVDNLVILAELFGTTVDEILILKE